MTRDDSTIRSGDFDETVDPALERRLHETLRAEAPEGLADRVFQATAGQLGQPVVVARIGLWRSAARWASGIAAGLLIIAGLTLALLPADEGPMLAALDEAELQRIEQALAGGSDPIDTQLEALGAEVSAVELSWRGGEEADLLIDDTSIDEQLLMLEQSSSLF